MALNHQEPDRVPIDLGASGYVSMTALAYRRLKDYLGLVGEDEIINAWQTMDSFDERILERLDIDFRRVALRAPHNFRPQMEPDGSWTEEWGWRVRRVTGRLEIYTEFVSHPIEEPSLEALDDYLWPDPYDPGRTEGLAQEAKTLYENTDYALVTKHLGPGPFEACCLLRGYDIYLMDMVLNKEFAIALIEKVVEILIGFYQVLLDAVGHYVDIIEAADDLGMQDGPMMSPALYREIVKPAHLRLYRFIKSKTQAKIMHHSDGSCYELIPDLLETGIDILNPIQTMARDMDPARIKRQFGQQLTLHGAIDQQQLLPRGTPDEIREAVRNTMETLGPGGGYIFAVAHNIQGDVPPENVVALFDAAQRARTLSDPGYRSTDIKECSNMNMTNKEIMQATFAFEEPDRVAIQILTEFECGVPAPNELIGFDYGQGIVEIDGEMYSRDIWGALLKTQKNVEGFKTIKPLFTSIEEIDELPILDPTKDRVSPVIGFELVSHGPPTRVTREEIIRRSKTEWIMGWIPEVGLGVERALGANLAMQMISFEPKTIVKFLQYLLHLDYLWLGAYAQLGVDEVVLGAGLLSHSVISPRTYREMFGPYHKKVIRRAHEYGIKVRIHMCGRSRENWQAIVEQGFDAMEPIDPMYESLREAKDLVGDKMVLIGNVNPLTFFNGNVDDVIEETKDCLRIGMPGGGYILGTGDSLSILTPPRNIKAMYEAGLIWGTYPIRKF